MKTISKNLSMIFLIQNLNCFLATLVLFVVSKSDESDDYFLHFTIVNEVFEVTKSSMSNRALSVRVNKKIIHHRNVWVKVKQWNFQLKRRDNHQSEKIRKWIVIFFRISSSGCWNLWKFIDHRITEKKVKKKRILKAKITNILSEKVCLSFLSDR